MNDRRPLTRQESGRLGGLMAAQRMTPDARRLRAEKAQAAWQRKYGKAGLVRMNFQRNGRLEKGALIKDS